MGPETSINLNNLPAANLIDRFDQQDESEGSTLPATASPDPNVSPIRDSRSPTHSRSPLRRAAGATGGDPETDDEMDDPDDGLQQPDDMKNVSTKARKGSSYDDEMDDPDDDLYEPDDVRDMSTKARKGSSANPSPPHSSTPTPAMSRELRRLRDFNNPGLKEGLGRGRTRSKHD